MAGYVLTRKLNQRMLVSCQCGCGHSMWVEVVRIGETSIRLAFDSSAPQMTVEREEKVR